MILVDQIAGNSSCRMASVHLMGQLKGCLIKHGHGAFAWHLGIALLGQHRLNATCSNRLFTPLKPHAHILMYKSGAASVCAISQAI